MYFHFQIIIFFQSHFPKSQKILQPSNNRNNRNTRKRSEICLKLTTQTPEQHQRRRPGVLVNFEHISQRFLMFLLLALNM